MLAGRTGRKHALIRVGKASFHQRHEALQQLSQCMFLLGMAVYEQLPEAPAAGRGGPRSHPWIEPGAPLLQRACCEIAASPCSDRGSRIIGLCQNLLSAFLPPLEIRDEPLGSLLELNATCSLA
jgi:hypothetical protein